LMCLTTDKEHCVTLREETCPAPRLLVRCQASGGLWFFFISLSVFR
jgi:hypothetical protein